MKYFFIFLPVSFLFVSCGFNGSSEDEKADDSIENQKDEDENGEQVSSDEISFEVHMEELYGDWVLIGVGADRMGPGVAPVGEIMFAFRDNGSMTVATEGREEIKVNLAGIPSPYEIKDKKLCSDDIMFKLQFKQPCAEIIRLNEGRMSIKIEIPGGAGFLYKHFVKLDD